MAGSLHEGGPRHVPESEVLKPQDWNFDAFTKRVGEIYKKHNEEVDYQPDTMFAKLIGNARTLKKASEAKPPQLADVSSALTRTLAWLGSIALDGGLSLDKMLMEKYGRGCPRCHCIPCNLAEGKACEKTNVPFQQEELPASTTIDGWCDHLARIYPNNYNNADTASILKHVAYRVLDEAEELLSSTHPDIERVQSKFSHHDLKQDESAPWRGEFADVLAWSLATAEALRRISNDYSLEKSLKETYKEGCPSCGSSTCVCPREKTVMEALRKRDMN